jgi:hypothetical protein
MQQRDKAVDALQLLLLAASKAGLLMLAECHAQSSRTQPIKQASRPRTTERDQEGAPQPDITSKMLRLDKQVLRPVQSRL